MCEECEREFDERLDQMMVKFRVAIDDVGWAALGVFPEGPGEPTFTYTIGLTETLQHPELIVYGMHYKQAHAILYSAIEMIKKEGIIMIPGERYPEVVRDYDVMVKYVEDEESRPLNMATRFYDHPVIAMQLLWPDKNGKFPGEEGVDEGVENCQKEVAE